MTTKQTPSRIALALVLALGLGVGGRASATGIPVVDVAGLAQAVEQYTTLTAQLETLKQQYDTALSQLESLKQQATTLQNMYSDFSGVGGHAAMLQNTVAQLHSFIPVELSNPSSLVSGQLSGIVAQLRSAREKMTAQELFPGKNEGSAREQYQQASDQAFGYRALAKAAYDKFADRRAQLESLNGAGATATTPGSKLDLIAKGNSEIVLILNDIAQMMAAQMGANADRDILNLNQLSTSSAEATSGN